MSNKLKLAIIFGAVYFFSPNGLGGFVNQPILYLLKEVLKMTATQTAYFSGLTILGWAIKPLFGFISDFFALWNSRRKSYLIITTLLASLIWFCLAFQTNYNILILLILLTFSSFAYAFQDVVTDALMVENGKKLKAVEFFQSAQWFAVSVAQVITGISGGLAAMKLSYQTTFALAGVFPLLVLILIIWLVQETTPELKFKNELKVLKKIFTSKEFLFISLFLFLWNFSPSFGTPFFYYQIDVLKFSKIFIGTLASLSSIGAVIGTIIFPRITKNISLKKLLISLIFVSVIITLFYLLFLVKGLIEKQLTVQLISIILGMINGFLGMIAFLAILTFAAQKTEALVAGTIFAFLMAIINLSAMSSSFLGGWLYGKIGLGPLIILSAFSSLLPLLVIKKVF